MLLLLLVINVDVVCGGGVVMVWLLLLLPSDMVVRVRCLLDVVGGGGVDAVAYVCCWCWTPCLCSLHVLLCVFVVDVN